MSTPSRAVIQKTDPENVEFQVNFETQRFDSLVFDKGYNVYIDRAFRCPCAVKATGQALLDCDNCLGVGWVYTNRIETKLVLQTIKADVKYENWSKTTRGMARVTSRAIDKLSFMDRIILRDVEGYYNEILRSQRNGSKLNFYTNYGILEIENILIFVNSTTRLRYLTFGTDYNLDPTCNTRIILSTEFDTITAEVVATIRYRHQQTFHIIDMNRDITKVRERDCSSEQLEQMPIYGIARKAHYLFDNARFGTQEPLDNTQSII